MLFYVGFGVGSYSYHKNYTIWFNKYLNAKHLTLGLTKGISLGYSKVFPRGYFTHEEK